MSHTTKRGSRMRAWARFPVGGFIAGAVILVFIVAAVFSTIVAPFDPNDQNAGLPYDAPSLAHPFGVDPLGRDVLSRVIDAARIALPVAFGSVLIALIIGAVVGILAGYFGGWVDGLLSRAMDVIFAFPALLLAIILMAVFSPSLLNAIVAIGVVYAPRFARVARGETLAIATREFVDAARLSNVPVWLIMFRHILGNISAPLITLAALSMSTSLLTYSALSFLGLGVGPPQADYGSMLAQAVGSMTFAPWLVIFPALSLVVLIGAFNNLGDAARETLDRDLS